MSPSVWASLQLVVVAFVGACLGRALDGLAGTLQQVAAAGLILFAASRAWGYGVGNDDVETVLTAVGLFLCIAGVARSVRGRGESVGLMGAGLGVMHLTALLQPFESPVGQLGAALRADPIVGSSTVLALLAAPLVYEAYGGWGQRAVEVASAVTENVPRRHLFWVAAGAVSAGVALAWVLGIPETRLPWGIVAIALTLGMALGPTALWALELPRPASGRSPLELASGASPVLALLLLAPVAGALTMAGQSVGLVIPWTPVSIVFVLALVGGLAAAAAGEVGKAAVGVFALSCVAILIWDQTGTADAPSMPSLVGIEGQVHLLQVSAGQWMVNRSGMVVVAACLVSAGLTAALVASRRSGKALPLSISLVPVSLLGLTPMALVAGHQWIEEIRRVKRSGSWPETDLLWPMPFEDVVVWVLLGGAVGGWLLVLTGLIADDVQGPRRAIAGTLGLVIGGAGWIALRLPDATLDGSAWALLVFMTPLVYGLWKARAEPGPLVCFTAAALSIEAVRLMVGLPGFHHEGVSAGVSHDPDYGGILAIPTSWLGGACFLAGVIFTIAQVIAAHAQKSPSVADA